MSNRRWSKFWWQDWQREPSLQMCSLAAQGLWMRLLCVAHDGEPHGHVTVNGAAPTMKQIGRLASIGEREAATLVKELEDAGVFSRTPEGIIFSRRMVRDKVASDAGREHGKDGGNPNLKPATTKTHKAGGGGGGLTPPDNRGPNHQEAEADTERKEPATLGADAPPPDARAELWGDGLALLRGLTGKPDGPSRGLLGRLVKAARDDCPAVMRALRTAADLRPVDPVPWLMAALNQPDDDTRLLQAAGLLPTGPTLDGDALELFPRRLN